MGNYKAINTGEKMKFRILQITFLFLINISVAQNSINLLGKFASPNAARYSDVWGYVDENGREYALLLSYEGTYIIDVTDPTNPVEIEYIDGINSIWRDAKVHGNYAYVVTEGNNQQKPHANGLQIIDLSNLPNSAALVTTVNDIFNSAHNIFIEDGYAYVVGTEAENGIGGVHIIDLSDPLQPHQVAYYAESGYVHDVYVSGDILIVCSANDYAYVDISNKANPQLISSSASIQADGGYAHSGWMTEDKRYFYATDEGNSFDLRVYDLQDRNTWEVSVNSWQMQSQSIIHNLFIRGNYAHISYYTDGYVVLDISNPESPKIAGQYDTADDGGSGFNGAWGCYPYLPSGNILISDVNFGLFVFDFTEDGITDVKDNNELPEKFSVAQNYPNPFNPTTKITFSLPSNEFVTVDVFNILGQKVAALVNDSFNAGAHSVDFNAQGLGSGIYLAKISAGSNTKLIKMNLVK